MLHSVILLVRSAQLELIPLLGRVCPELPLTIHDRPYTISMHTLLPAPILPLDGGALRVSICGLLVPREREGMGLSTDPSPTCSAEAQIFRRHPSVRPPSILARRSVWLSTRDLHLCLPCKKLSTCYIGPFPIQRQVNEGTYQLHLPARYKIHPTFLVSLLKPFSPSTTGCTEPDVPPPPEVLEEAAFYQVHDILDSWRCGARLEYLVHSDGYGLVERSWVARDDILDPLRCVHSRRHSRIAPQDCLSHLCIDLTCN